LSRSHFARGDKTESGESGRAGLVSGVLGISILSLSKRGGLEFETGDFYQRVKVFGMAL
jgi:hypothetical protein